MCERERDKKRQLELKGKKKGKLVKGQAASVYSIRGKTKRRGENRKIGKDKEYGKQRQSAVCVGGSSRKREQQRASNGPACMLCGIMTSYSVSGRDGEESQLTDVG